MARRTTRRQFLREAGAAGIGFWLAGGVSLGVPKSKGPLEKLNIACIGVGGKGESDATHAGNHGNIIALCDIDDHFLDHKAQGFPRAKKYNDYRKMLDELGKDIDAVTVSTPDHTHAPASIMAMNLKKHVYCQKPLTHTVKEARMMREVARKNHVCTQMGNQGSATDGLREAVEVIQAGLIGPVTEAHVWTNRPVWPQAPKITSRPEPSEPPPHVHWDLWLAAAPVRPYSGVKQYNGHPPYHDFNWRGWWDFGTGALGDMACHTANMAFRALKLEYPSSVQAENGELNPETYPAWATITFHFPARGSMPPVKLVWYEGQRDGKKNLPPKELLHGEVPPGSGSLLVGKKGILYSPDDYGEMYMLLPKADFKDVKKPDHTVPRRDSQKYRDIDDYMKLEWVRAIHENKPEVAYSNFDFAALLTETILLGNVAMRTKGAKLEWDGPSLRFTNAPQANAFLTKEYRKGWEV
jgi:predicted dehydrogenase